MINILKMENNIDKEKDIDCMFLANKNCKILRKKECDNCKFYKRNTPENYEKYVIDVKESIKKYTMDHK